MVSRLEEIQQRLEIDLYDEAPCYVTKDIEYLFDLVIKLRAERETNDFGTTTRMERG